jgi:hypothetical protein
MDNHYRIKVGSTSFIIGGFITEKFTYHFKIPISTKYNLWR